MAAIYTCKRKQEIEPVLAKIETICRRVKHDENVRSISGYRSCLGLPSSASSRRHGVQRAPPWRAPLAAGRHRAGVLQERALATVGHGDGGVHVEAKEPSRRSRGEEARRRPSCRGTIGGGALPLAWSNHAGEASRRAIAAAAAACIYNWTRHKQKAGQLNPRSRATPRRPALLLLCDGAVVPVDLTEEGGSGSPYEGTGVSCVDGRVRALNLRGPPSAACGPPRRLPLGLSKQWRSKRERRDANFDQTGCLSRPSTLLFCFLHLLLCLLFCVPQDAEWTASEDLCPLRKTMATSNNQGSIPTEANL